MLEYRSSVHNYISSHKDEIIEILRQLVAIPSVRGEAQEGAPYGVACREALEKAYSLFVNEGFESEIDCNEGYAVSYFGNGERTIGLFAHSDVVAPGDEWTYSEPFELYQKDGYLFGRGVADDKCAIVTALFISKMLKELDIPFNAKLVCFTGCCEETGMDDIRNYVKTHKAPDFSIISDASFPMFRGDKGTLRFSVKFDDSFDKVLDFGGGKSYNIVLGEATAKLPYDNELFESVKSIVSDSISVSESNGEILVEAKGVPAHAALPQYGVNAGLLLADALCKCQKLPNKDIDILAKISKLLSQTDGNAFGIESSDEDFGALTCGNGIIRLDNGKPVLTFDVRFGRVITVDEMKKRVENACKAMGASVEFISDSPWYLTDKNHPMLVKCLDVYKQFTGNMDAKAGIDPGGTYGKFLPCAVEIGTQTRKQCPFEFPKGHGSIHQSDECISVEGMLEAMEIATLMVIECGK